MPCGWGIANAVSATQTFSSEFILDQLNQHLATHPWLELDRPTIADVAVFPYVALARDGKIHLDAYGNVLAWIDRVKQLPGFVGMQGIESAA